MRKKIIVISSILVIVLLALMCLLFTPRSIYEVDLETDITVQGGVAQSEPLECVFEISKDGEYVMYTDWEISPEGMLMACSIMDENGKDVNTFSAHWINMTSGAMLLEAGKYTMTLTPLTSAEQWKEYFAGFDTSDWDVPVEEAEPEMVFATDGEFHFDFDFRVGTHKDMQGITIVLVLAISALLIVVLLAMTQKGEGLKQNYDERQELLRGKGFKYAFYTMLILNFALFTFETAEVYLPMSAGIAMFFSELIGVGVYAVYCIWKDAYFALNQKANTLTAVFFVMGTMNLMMGIDAFVKGVAIQNNQLTFRSMNLFCGILMLVLCGTLLLKKFCQDREEE